MSTPDPMNQPAPNIALKDAIAGTYRATALDRVLAARELNTTSLADRINSAANALREQEIQNQRQEELGYGNLGTDSDIARTITGGVSNAVGSIIKGAGYIDKQVGLDTSGDFLQAQGGSMQGYGQEALGARDANTLGAIANSTPTGDVFDPSSYDFGEDPSAKGYGYQLLGVLSEFAPQAASLLVSGPAGPILAGVTGGLQAGTAQADDAEQYIQGLSEQELTENSALYQDLRSQDIAHEEAKAQVAASAKAVAFATGAVIGGAGGAATNYILKPLQKKLGGSIAGRTLKTAALSGVEEGTQEVAESVLSRAAANAIAGTSRDISADTFGDLVLGGSFGAGLGGVGGAVAGTAEAVSTAADKRIEKARIKRETRLADAAATAAQITTGAETGDFSSLTDPIERQATSGESTPRVADALDRVTQAADSTPETKEKALEAISEIEDEVLTSLDDAQAEYDNPAAFFAAKREKAEQVVEKANAKIERLNTEGDPNGALPRTTEIRDSFVEQVEQFRQLEESGTGKEARKALSADIKNLSSELEQITKIREGAVTRFNDERGNSTQALVDQATSAESTPDVKTQAAKTLLQRGLTDASSVSTSSLNILAADESLPEPVRQRLRELTELRVAENALKNPGQVEDDIMVGSAEKNGYLSLPEYRSFIGKALAAGKEASAAKAFGMLANFAADHTLKAKMSREAFDAVKASPNGNTQQAVLANRTKGEVRWMRQENAPGGIKFLRDAEVRKNGGLTISTGSEELITAIEAESYVLNENVRLLRASLVEQFGESFSEYGPDTQPTTEVPAAEASVAEESSVETQETSEVAARPESDGMLIDAGIPGADPKALDDTEFAEALRYAIQRFGTFQLRTLRDQENHSAALVDARHDLDLLADIYFKDADPALKELYTLMTSRDDGVPLDELRQWVDKHSAKVDDKSIHSQLLDKFQTLEVIQTLPNITISVPMDRTYEGKEILPTGVYEHVDHRFGLNPFGFDTKVRTLKHRRYRNHMADSVVHELVHALSHDIIENDLDVAADIAEMRKVVREWMQDEKNLKDVHPDALRKLKYMTTSLHEFVSVGMSEPLAMRELARIPMESQGDPVAGLVIGNVFSKLMITIRKMVRKSLKLEPAELSVLDNVLALGDRILEIQEATPRYADGNPLYEGTVSEVTVNADTKRTNNNADGNSDSETRSVEEPIDSAPREDDSAAPESTRATARETAGDPESESESETESETEDRNGQEPVAVATQTEPAQFASQATEDGEAVEPVVGAMTKEQVYAGNKFGRYFTFGGRTAIGKYADFIKSVLAPAAKSLDVLVPFLSKGRKEIDAILADEAREKKVKELLDTVVKHEDMWSDKIDSLYLEKKPGYEWQGMLNDFIKDGVLDKPVKDVIIVAALGFIMQTGNSLWYNDAKGKRRILFLDENDPIPPNTGRRLATIGQRQNGIILQIGGAASKALDARLNKSAPRNEQSQLDGALGAMALALLMDAGYLQRRQLPDITFNEDAQKLWLARKAREVLTDTEVKQLNKAESAQHYFVRSNRVIEEIERTNWKTGKLERVKVGTANPELDRLRELLKGNTQLFDSLFGTDFTKPGPTLKPLKTRQEKAKNSDRLVTDEQLALINKANAKGYQLHGNLYSNDENGNKSGILDRVSREFIERVIGVVDLDAADARVHVRNIENVRARNEGLQREIDLMDDHIDARLNNDPTRKFYFQNEVWKMFRVGIKSAGVNPQASKFHRAVMSVGSFDYQVDPNQPGQTFDSFKMSVIEALGGKTEGNRDAVLAEFDALLHDDDMAIALFVAHELNTDPTYSPTAEGEAEMARVVALKGENMHSFTGLLALARYQQSLIDGKPFTSNLFREVDGKTNGPMIGLMTMGLKFIKERVGYNSDMMAMGGFYQDGSRYKSFDDYAERVGMDLYKSVASGAIVYMQEELRNGFAVVNGRKVKSRMDEFKAHLLTTVLGDLKSDEIGSGVRNMTKGPVTQIVFGAGMKKTITNMSEEFIEQFVTNLEKHAGDASKIEPMIEALNDLLDKEHRIVKRDDNNYLGVDLTFEQELALKRAFRDTFGAGVRFAIESQFEDMLAVRKSMNETINMMSRMYIETFNARVRQAQRQQRDKLRKDARFKPDAFKTEAERRAADPAIIGKIDDKDYEFDLSRDQKEAIVDELAEMFPSIHTAFTRLLSNNDGNRDIGVSHGLGLLKTRLSSTNSGGYRGEQRFNAIRYFSGEGESGQDTDTFKSITYNGLRETLEEPGVSGGPMSTHSQDSFVAMLTYAQLDVMNNHDAVTGSAETIHESAKVLNENMFKVLSEYSVPWEVMTSFYRVLEEFEVTKKEFADDPTFQEQLKWLPTPVTTWVDNQPIVSESSLTPAAEARIHLNRLAAAHTNKLDFMSKLGIVDQYPVAGGKYEVSDEQRKALEARTTDELMYEHFEAEYPQHFQNKDSVAPAATVPKRKSSKPTGLRSEVENFFKSLNTALGKTASLNEAMSLLYKSERYADVRDNWQSQVEERGSRLLALLPENRFKRVHELRDQLETTHKRMDSEGKTHLMAPLDDSDGDSVSGESIESEQIKLFTTEEVFNALNRDTPMAPSQATRLKALLTDLTTKLSGPMGMRRLLVEAELNETPLELMGRLVQNDQIPFSSRATGTGMKFTSAEAYALEQIELTMQTALTHHAFNGRAIDKIYREAKSRITPEAFHDSNQGEWAQATPDERAQAEAIHDFIFRIRADVGESNATHLSRFTALALVYPPFQKALVFTPKDVNEGVVADTLGKRLKALFDDFVQRLSNMINRVDMNQSAGQQLDGLVRQLVINEKKRKAEIAAKRFKLVDRLEDEAASVGEKLTGLVAKAGRSDLIQNNNLPFVSKQVRAVGDVAALVAEDKVGDLFNLIEEWQNYEHKEAPKGFLMSLLSEMRGETDETSMFYRMLARASTLQQRRKEYGDNIANEMLESFANHSSMTHDDKAAITQLYLRSDLQSLRDDYSIDDIGDFILDNTKRARVIDALTNQVLANAGGSKKLGRVYLRETKELAYLMATGSVTGRFQYDNAYNLARQMGKGFKNTRLVQEEVAQGIEPAIDQLASLLAIEYAPGRHKARIARIIESEKTKQGVNALDYVLQTHQRFQREAREDLFGGNPTLMSKGYVKEIYDPHNTLVAANDAKGATLMKKGYVRISDVPVDALDPGLKDGQAFYVLKGIGMQSRETGALSFTNEATSGTTMHSTITNNVQGAEGIRNWKVNRVERVRRGSLKTIKDRGDLTDAGVRAYDPRAQSSGLMAPVFNPYGEVVNYRYMMNHANRDNHLNRNNDFDAILGNVAASQYDKVNSKELNRDIIQGLHDFHRDDTKNRSGSSEGYVEVSLEAKDPAMRDAYRLLPEASKEMVREIWGADRMYVRNDVLDLITGYQNLSLSNAFGKDENARNIAEAVLVKTLEHIYGEKAAAKFRRAEDMWESAVRLFKDIIVVRNLETLWGNVVSNVTLLVWYGVPPRKMARWHVEAIDGLKRYTDDQRKLMRMQNRLMVYPIVEGSAESKTPLAERVRELEASMALNPVKSLIDEGMFQTIMEDIDTEKSANEGRYKDQFNTVIDAGLDKLPGVVRTAGNQLMVGKDTRLYKALFTSTQYSDFVGRYVLYNHLTTRSRDPMSHDKAISEIRQAFVNYDAPSHRLLQKANMLGAVVFTKYYLRSQKIIFKLMREAPGRALGIAAADKYVMDMQTILESNMLSRVGNNPFQPGALMLVDSLDEPVPIKTLLGILD